MLSAINLSGLITDPSIQCFNDFRVELIRFLIKQENKDILETLNSDILSGCELRHLKDSGYLRTVVDYKLVVDLYQFLNNNLIILNRFPSYLTRYLNTWILEYRSQKQEKEHEQEQEQDKNFMMDSKNRINYSKTMTKKQEGYKKMTNCLMLRNIKKHVTEYDLKNLMSSHNLEIQGGYNMYKKSIHFPYHKNKKDRMNYAFVTFKDINEARKAESILNGYSWNDCVLGILNAKGNCI